MSFTATPVPLENGKSLKPCLTKISAIDVSEEETKKLSRGISRTAENAGVISQIRNEVCVSLSEVEESNPNGHFTNALDTNDCTFTLPDLSIQSDEFRQFLENELIDTSMSISLQEAARLNWWTCLDEGCERLWPLSTTGDGNCLLHAASLGMWGFHDRLLILRKALHSCLTTGTFRHALWRRWRWQNARSNLQAGLDLHLNEEEWQREWDNILKLASSQPRTSGSSTPLTSETETDSGYTNNGSTASNKTYESLEEIHVLALAHVLKRPIFVIADTVLKDVNGEALAPITFGGIYLPLEIEPSECTRSPLVLAYDAAHFSALVAMAHSKTSPKISPLIETESEPPAVIPLVDVDRDLLPIQFEVDPGESCLWNHDEVNDLSVQRIELTHEDRLALLNQFLDLVDIPCPSVIKRVGSKKQPKMKNDTKGNGTLARPAHDSEGWNSDSESRSNKTLANKQLHSVAKQFGSLGRSVGRRLKRNLMENFTLKHTLTAPTPIRLNNGHSAQWECPDFILCARLHTEKHHPYLEQMIVNYMQSARTRFEQQQAERQKQSMVNQRRQQHTLAEMAIQEGPSPCINPNCIMFGTALTSYMCTACYTKQLEEEEERAKNFRNGPTARSPTGTIHQNALYGAGKSVFYAHSDSQSYAEVANIPARKPPTGQTNGTLYLSNSTFYGESLAKQQKPVKEEKIVFEKITVNVISDKQKITQNSAVVEPLVNLENSVPSPRSGSERNGLQSSASNKSNLPVNPVTEAVVHKELAPVPAPRTKGGKTGMIEQPRELVTDLTRSPSDGRKRTPPIRPTELQPQKSIPAANQAFPVLSKPLSVDHTIQPTSRLLSHYDSIRKLCKSSGCSDFGQANTQWFCSGCYHTRRKAALARESIIENMKAAQMQ